MTVIDQKRRPWLVSEEIWEDSTILFRVWLSDRGGVVVYENLDMSSSQVGATSFMPARYVGRDEQVHDAPARIGDLPSKFQYQVDHIKIEQYDGDIEKAMAAFVKEPAPAAKPPSARATRKRKPRS